MHVNCSHYKDCWEVRLLRWAQETDDDDDGEGEADEKTKTKQRKNRNVKKNKKKGGGKSKTLQASKSEYKPGDYAEIRKQFIKEARENGMSFKDAQLAWASSDK